LHTGRLQPCNPATERRGVVKIGRIKARYPADRGQLLEEFMSLKLRVGKM